MKASRDLGPEVVIRTLSYPDLPEIMEIENASYSTPWREATMEGLLRRDDSDLIGATNSGRLLGYAICWTIGDQAELGNVAVAPAERGRGIGKRLVEAVIARIRARGARECFLEVRESNKSARSLYERCGFKIIGRRRHYYTRPMEDALVMRLDLV